MTDIDEERRLMHTERLYKSLLADLEGIVKGAENGIIPEYKITDLLKFFKPEREDDGTV
jgi:hypothetical protein